MPHICGFLGCTAKLAALFQKILKKVSALRVNRTKVTLRNASIDNLFPLESEKKIKK